MQVPEGWQLCTIGDVSKINTGAKDTQDREENGKYPFFVRSQTIERINSYSFDGEAILTAGDGVGVGKVFHYLNCKFDYHQRVYNIHNFSENVSGRYVYQYFKQNFIRRVQKLSAKNSVDSVRMEMISKMPLPLPPLPEQKKIAEILSACDECIENTEKQITKLKDLKKATMQELLTKGIGHTEFKDSPLGRIPKSWEVKYIGDKCKVIRGASPRPIGDPKYFGGNVGWVKIADVTASNKFLKKTKLYLSSLGESKSVRVRHGDLIMSICGTVGKPIIVDMDACIHDGFVQFTNIQELDVEFLYYLLQIKVNIFISKAQPGTQINLNTTIVGGTQFGLPPLPEQKKIAGILSSIDSNIENKEQKLSKLKDQKKALMNDLLTGKVRVKIC